MSGSEVEEMKAPHWWMIVGNVAVIGSALWVRGLLQIICLSILLAMYVAEYIEISIKYERHITEHPISKDYMRGVQEGMRMGYAKRVMDEEEEKKEAERTERYSKLLGVDEEKGADDDRG